MFHMNENVGRVLCVSGQDGLRVCLLSSAGVCLGAIAGVHLGHGAGEHPVHLRHGVNWRCRGPVNYLSLRISLY